MDAESTVNYSLGTIELWQLHNAEHTITILSMVEYSESVLVIIALIGNVASRIVYFCVVNQ